MPRQLNHFRYLGAAGVLALGTACAANVYLKPPSYRGPDTAQLRQLADRVTAAPPLQDAPLYVPPARHYEVAVPTTQVRTRPTAPQVAAKPQVTEAPKPEVTKPTPEAAVKQIALTGVTQQGDAPTAWLVDIETHERETVAAGESAFGFVVKEISAESVLLAQDGEEFTVHMGDKEIPAVEPDPSLNPAPPVAQNPNDGGQGRRGWRGFTGGGGNWAGRWSGGGGNRGGWTGGGNRNWSRGGTTGNNVSRPRFSGNFGGGNFSGFGGQNFNQNSNRNSNQNRSTANPQEARRRGSRLMGGATAMPTPAAIRNPQTSRRRGTNSGRAFGSDPNWR